MTVHRDQIALNAIQWINIKENPADPDSPDVWLYREPRFKAMYPDVLAQIARAGFDAVMMEVLDTQTLQHYARMIEDSGLRLAPGYCAIGLPEDSGLTMTEGSSEWIRWFDDVRRKAEESNYFELSTVFLAPRVSWEPGQLRTLEAVAVGAGFDAGRLDRVTHLLGTAAEVLAEEGVRAGLHNHVGTWVETEDEIDHVLSAIRPDILGASFDIGHLAWAGIDPARMIAKHSDRMLDLHIKDLDVEIAAASRRTPMPYRTATRNGIFLEPGLGGIDIPGSLAALPVDFSGWVIIEVDRASMDPFDSALVSRDWVARNVAELGG